MDQSVNPNVNQAEDNSAENDQGLVSTLNLTFAVDPNAGSEMDGYIAQFIENCLKIPVAIEWEDMKVMREVYKHPKNSQYPNTGAPMVPDSLSATMLQAARDRGKHMGYIQAWAMTALSAMGSLVSDPKPFEMDNNVPWVRPVYAKALDIIRILSHLSVNEVSKRRKAEVKTYLPAQYKMLATPKPKGQKRENN